MLDKLTPKARVFARGFVTHMLTNITDPSIGVALRKCQDAGNAAIIDQEETISVPYISKLTNQLEASGAIIKVRRGKHFHVVPGAPSVWADTIAKIEEGYGETMEELVSDEVVQARSTIIDYMKHNLGVVIDSARPLDRVRYQVLIEKFKAGKLKMAFYDADCRAMIADPDTNVHKLHELP